MRISRSRQGFNLIGLVLLLMILGGAGLFFARLASQSGRASHWFHLSQAAYDLADAGMKHVVFRMQAASSVARAQASPELAALARVTQALVDGSDPGRVTLMSSSDRAALPASLQAHLSDSNEWSPRLEVWLEVVGRAPLWSAPLDGLPADPREQKGAVRLTAHATIRHAAGQKVERRIVVERPFKVVSVMPPLVGRFALFVAQLADGQDPNFVKVKFDKTNGDAQAEPGSPLPLVLQQPAGARAIEPPNRLDRAAMGRDVPDARFLDKQGWVYLGGPRAWKLRLAHGYSGTGESPLLPGPRLRCKFKGSDNEDQEFQARFKNALQPFLPACTVDFDPAKLDGLLYCHHGLASNYEIISLELSRHHVVQDASGARTRLNLGVGDGAVSCLRLFGTPDRLGPTLVLGPAQRVYAARALVQATVTSGGSGCATAGTVMFPVYRPEDHVPNARNVLAAAFQNLDEHGTGVREDAYGRSLRVALDPDGSGEYGPEGTITRKPGNASGPAYGSDLVPNLGAIAGPAPDPDPLDALVTGILPQGCRVFEGSLANGFGALWKALEIKKAYQCQELPQRMLDQGTLKLPGIVWVTAGAPLRLGPIARVPEGGILMARGDIEIRGDIVRDTPAEPLTLVSLEGKIAIADPVRRVDAYLIAPKGTVTMPDQVTINGGVACDRLPLEEIRAKPAARVIAYSPDMDPFGARAAAAYRVLYGGAGAETRVSVGGGEL